MDLFILVNGKMVPDKVKENNIGQMDLFMKAIGKITWLLVRVD